MTKLFLRIEFGDAEALGPGKVRLLELLDELGSISAAGRAMGMSYKQDWSLIDAMNRTFAQPVALGRAGGAKGGGAGITPFGRDLAKRYRRMEAAANKATSADMRALSRAVAPPKARPGAARARKTAR
jgi:molybdate transport system regulatory protein